MLLASSGVLPPFPDCLAVPWRIFLMLNEHLPWLRNMTAPACQSAPQRPTARQFDRVIHEG